MKIPLYFLSFVSLLLVSLGDLSAAEPGGAWKAPSPDGRAWKHEATGLSFPQVLGGYDLAGEFSYDAGGSFIRYENLDQRARADVFFFKLPNVPASLEDKQRLILNEMDVVKVDFEAMVKQGRYKGMQVGEFALGELDLWQKESLPIATRVITATRLGFSDEGAAEAEIRQWTGITIFEGHMITIRYMRPADTGDTGEAAMKGFVGLLFQILKDPSLRSHIQELVWEYLANPLSNDGEQAAAAVLAYLKQTPYFPINIPEQPVAVWLDHCAKKAPGTEQKLLSAFMLGSAKAAFEDASAETCLNEGSRQFAKIYRQLAAQTSQIALPEIDAFATAAEKGLGAAWMKEWSLRQ